LKNHDCTAARGCKLADVFSALALLLIAFIAFATGFETQFNGLANIAKLPQMLKWGTPSP
jgi:hypothetical protein